jgi:hypothetical protein
VKFELIMLAGRPAMAAGFPLQILGFKGQGFPELAKLTGMAKGVPPGTGAKAMEAVQSLERSREGLPGV